MSFKSTSIRPLSKLLEKAAVPFWVVDDAGQLVFVSAAVGDWLDVDPDSLVGRKCVAGASISEDPLDSLAASLAAPPGIRSRGTAALMIQPAVPVPHQQPPGGLVPHPQPPPPRDTRFIRLGSGEHAGTLAVAGSFTDHAGDADVHRAVSLRQQLDGWRRHHDALASVALIGSSRLSERTRTQVQLCGSVRSHLVILSPPGSLAESIARTVHQRSAPGEAVAVIDGPLMDAELLDASLGTVLHYLTESETTPATAILQSIDETPIEAQQRLAEWIKRFGGRLRLIALASAAPRSAVDEGGTDDQLLYTEEDATIGIDASLADHLCGLLVRMYPISERVEDIPLLATALLDRRRAAGDGNADRFSRAALDALVLYPWPDNLRELDEAVRHAIRGCRGEAISPDQLPLAIRSYRPNQAPPVEQQTIDLDRAVANFELDLIKQAVESSGGNRAEAARRLNISRARLLRKLESADGDEG
jgi:DNA-binding NtrC family response regulator